MASEQKLGIELLKVYYANEDRHKQKSRQLQDIVKLTVKVLIDAMKTVDDLFSILYQENVYTGSYWENLRVKYPPEFDINMALRLPFSAKDVEIITSDKPDFFIYHLKNDVTTLLINRPKWPILKKLISFFNDYNDLSRPKIQCWIQSVITKAMNSNYFQLLKPKDIKSLKHKSGLKSPAFTYFITTNQNEQIDVDLVPVIFGCYPIPSEIYQSQRFINLISPYRDWYLVPKQHSASFTGYNDIFWRISFPEAEKNLLLTDEEGCAIKLIKLMKMLRDSQELYTIVSYYIKTIFLLELDLYPDKYYWHQDDIGSLMLKMLGKLQTALENKKLLYYFHRDANLLDAMNADNARNHANLLDAMNADNARNHANRIKYIIKEISTKPECVEKYFKPKVQKSSYQQNFPQYESSYQQNFPQYESSYQQNFPQYENFVEQQTSRFSTCMLIFVVLAVGAIWLLKMISTD